MEVKGNIVIVSGGFDPVHKGHINMFQEASKYGDVIVALNSDEWLKNKKGYNFMDWEERKCIVEEFLSVSGVIGFDDSDKSANNALKKVVEDYPDRDIYFANGGDRTKENIPEVKTCEDLGIKMLWNIGGEKVQSSSDMIKKLEGEN